jgi:uncharacterized protein
VINLVGEGIASRPWTLKRKAAIISSRVNGGKAITEAILQSDHKPAVLVQASGVGCYGTGEEQVFTEDDPYGIDFPAQICIQWEESTRAVERVGVRRIVTRFGVVLTARGGFLERVLLPFRLYAGGPLGDGKQWWSWIHYKDLVEAILYLVKHPDAQGPYNLTAPAPKRMADFGKTLGKIIHKPFWLHVPSFALKLALGELSTMVLAGQKVLPRQLEKMGFQFQFGTLEPALRDLFG